MLKVARNISWFLETYESVAEIVTSCVAQHNQHCVQRLLGKRLYQTIFDHIEYMYTIIDMTNVAKIRVLCESMKNPKKAYVYDANNELAIVVMDGKNIAAYDYMLDNASPYMKRESPVQKPPTMYVEFNDVILLMMDANNNVLGSVNVTIYSNAAIVKSRCIHPGDFIFCEWT